MCKPILVPFCILLCLFAPSCKKDNVQPESRTVEHHDGVEFTVKLPGLNNVVTTYSITDQEENAVKTVDVLAFKIKNRGMGNETETFAYRAKGVSIATPDASNPGNKIFKANLPKDSTAYFRFVVLANVRTQLNAISILANENKSSVLKKLVFERTGQWNANSTSNYDALPMWGESAQLIVDEKTDQIGRISLLRSLARVDVNLSGTALSNFVITSVNVINSRSNGLIAPLSGNYNATSGMVTAESIPSAAKFNTTAQTFNVPSPGKSLQQQVYVFESTKSSLMANQTTSTELIIAGRYNGSSTITYYRIAFLDSAGKALPLLRNHRYNVNITSVGGVGYPTFDIASRNVAANMTVVTQPWDDSGMSVMATDGQYILALNADQFSVGGAIGQKMNFTLYTDYPFGWNVRTDSAWLGITYYQNGRTAFITLITQGSSNIGAARPRTATITVTTGGGAQTGRITKTITVTQRNTN